jgi:hypothetical protein
MSLGDKLTSSEFSLLLVRARATLTTCRSADGLSRAALFGVSWTDPWTFWRLAIALLGTIGSCAWAVVADTRADALAEDDCETRTEASMPGHPGELAG